MKQCIAILGLLFIILPSFAQSDKVQWTTEVKELSEGKYQIDLIATVENGWYIYSQFMEPGGPIPTAITFENLDQPKASISEKVSESAEIEKEHFDTIFDITIKKFGGEVRFSKIIELKDEKSLIAKVTYMTCNDEMCLPPKEDIIPIFSNKL